MKKGRQMKTRAIFLAVVSLLLTGSMIACTPARNVVEPEPEAIAEPNLLSTLRSLGFGKYREEPELHPQHTQDGDWNVYTYPLEELRCMLGGEYFIQTRKGRESNKTVIWMDGGGSCWPGRDNCAKEAHIHSWIEAYGLASPEPDNPVKDWNFVYIPYCNGSSYMGDADADYDGDGEIDHWHWGLKTISAAVRLIAEQFPDTEKVLIAGCSAGGAGTIWVAPVVRLQFPDTNIYVLNISGPGLIKPEEIELRELIRTTWGIEQFIPAECQKCSEQIIYLYSWMLERDPALRVGIFSSYFDSAPISNWGMEPEIFRSLLLTTTEEIHVENPDRFKRFFITGDRHCMDNHFYEVSGYSFWEWIGYMVNDSPRWMDLLEQE